MMAGSPSRTLKLTYLGDASQLSRSTKTAGDDVESLGTRVGNFGKKAAIAFAAVATAGVVLGKKLFAAFEEVSTANARIDQVVTSMGNFEGQIGQVTDRLIKQAEATAKLTGVDRNLIKESQALLLTFDSVNKTANESGGVFDRATQAAVDLAAAGFGSVTGNAQQLGRALEDPIKGLTALTRSGVTFTEEQRNLIRQLVESNRTLEAQDIILQAIEKQVGGVAEATSNGSARMRQSFGILTESIAMALAPAFERLVELGLESIDKVGKWWEENGPRIKKRFEEIAGSIKEAWTEFRTFAGLVAEKVRAGGSFDRLKTRLQDARTAASGAGTAFNDLFGAFGKERQERNVSLVARFFEIYIGIFDKLIDRVEKFFTGLEKLFTGLRKVRDEIDAGKLGDLGFAPAGTLPGSSVGSAFGSQTLGQAGSRQQGNVIINVNGTVIDPEGAARSIADIANEQFRRNGGTERLE
jgi:hypothetical protein